MAQFYDESHRGYLAGSTLGQYVRVILSGSTANTVVVAGATDREIGVTTRKVNTSGDPVDILGATHEGTTPMVASGAITVNALVYAAASGKVTATAGENCIGRALVAASADGDVIEVQRLPALGSTTVTTGAVRGTVAAAGSAQGDATAIASDNVVVTAGDGTKGVVLPTAVPGQKIFLKNNAAAVLKVYPATGGAINALSANAAISMASLTSAVFFADSTTQWFTIPLLPS